MLQTCEPRTRSNPARRRSAPVPVLIAIPAVSLNTRAPRGRVRRRRLRREVRVAGYALLILLPITMALATLASDRRALARPGSLEGDDAPLAQVASSVRLEAPISLSSDELTPPAEPAPAVRVFLPGVVVPVEASEEPSHGGH